MLVQCGRSERRAMKKAETAAVHTRRRAQCRLPTLRTAVSTPSDHAATTTDAAAAASTAPPLRAPPLPTAAPAGDDAEDSSTTSVITAHTHSDESAPPTRPTNADRSESAAGCRLWRELTVALTRSPLTDQIPCSPRSALTAPSDLASAPSRSPCHLLIDSHDGGPQQRASVPCRRLECEPRQRRLRLHE